MTFVLHEKVKLRLVPLELTDANEFVEKHHRHHKRAQGHRFCIGALTASGALVACAIIGRPTSGLDPTRILEVTRMCSDGTYNACSFLYSAAARIGKAMGYAKIQTYIYTSENGASLKASGWVMERKAHPSGRHRKRSDGEERNTEYVEIAKALWSKTFVEQEQWAHHRNPRTDVETVCDLFGSAR
jgi:hypothetical protein